MKPFLTDGQILSALNDAMQLSQLKSDCLAQTSRQLRMPLTSILGMADFLEDTELTEEQKEYVVAIRHACRHVHSLTRELLDIAKLDVNYNRLDRDKTQLMVCLQECIQGVFPHQWETDEDVTLSLTLDEAIPEWVLTDAALLRRIMETILTLSRHLLVEGTINLHLSIQDVPDTVINSSLIGQSDDQEMEPWVNLRFTLTIPAILSTTLPLDEAFAQPNVLDVLTQSTGMSELSLSLAISQKLLRLLGGQLGATMNTDRETVIWFEIPSQILHAPKTCLLSSDDLPGEAVMVHHSSQLSGANLSHYRILLAEDDVINQKVVARYLEKMGFTVYVANNGKEVIQLTSIIPFDLVIMDCQMPEMDGYQSSQRIRARETVAEETHRLPIIALTANTSSQEEQQCLNSGMDAYLAKPFDKQALMALIGHYLDLQLV